MVVLKICLLILAFSQLIQKKKSTYLMPLKLYVSSAGRYESVRNTSRIHSFALKQNRQFSYSAFVVSSIQTWWLYEKFELTHLSVQRACVIMVYDDIASLSNNNIQNEIDAISVRRRDKFYPEMISLRNYIYQNLNSTFDTTVSSPKI